MRPIVKTVNLVKKFGEFIAVNRVNMEFYEGQLTSIIGPNGAGKTTLINVITGKFYPEEGSIYLYDKDITRIPPHRRIRMGLNRTFQIINIFPKLTVYENVKIPALSRDKKNADAIVEEILDLLNLKQYADSPAGILPFGVQKLIEISMALATKPKVLFLDEPTAGLNPVEKEAVMEAIKSLAKNTTVIVIEHDMDVVFEISERIVVMHQGQVIADGPPEQIASDERVIEVYLGESYE